MTTVPGLVSTIIPVFNRAEGLRAALTSVLDQDYRPIEVLIVDDGSTDGTYEVAVELARANPDIVRVIRQENAGPGVARETGRLAVRGEFIQYLDSDDVLLAGKFSAQVNSLVRDPASEISYGMVHFRRSDGSSYEGPWKRTGEHVQRLFPEILLERWWETAAPLYKRSLSDRCGPWLPLRHEEDWEYDCRLGATGVRLAYVASYVCEHRDHAGERLSRAGLTPQSLRDRAEAHQAMCAHALSSGLAREDPAFESFARRLFLLARQCGSAGLAKESAKLFALARVASTPRRQRAFEFTLYRGLSAVLGWTIVGKIACWSDKLRSGKGVAQ